MDEVSQMSYRKNDYPTGEEAESIVRFYYELTAEQYKHIKSIIVSDSKLYKKMIATLVVFNVAIAAMLLKIVHQLK